MAMAGVQGHSPEKIDERRRRMIRMIVPWGSMDHAVKVKMAKMAKFVHYEDRN